MKPPGVRLMLRKPRGKSWGSGEGAGPWAGLGYDWADLGWAKLGYDWTGLSWAGLN